MEKIYAELKPFLKNWGEVDAHLKIYAAELDDLRELRNELTQQKNMTKEVKKIEAKIEQLKKQVDYEVQCRDIINAALDQVDFLDKQILILRYKKHVAWDKVPAHLPMRISVRQCHRHHKNALGKVYEYIGNNVSQTRKGSKPKKFVLPEPEESRIGTIEIIKDQKEEVWKDIRGYEGLYQISNMGRVKSADNLLKPYIWNGRYIVSLYCDRVKVPFRVDRLVLATFAGIEITDKGHIGHKDGNFFNCRLSNLTYKTPITVTINGITHTVSEWADIMGKTRDWVYYHYVVKQRKSGSDKNENKSVH